MRNWKKILVTPKTSIRETIEIIDNSSMQIALVVDDSNRLLGTVTDGDIRRAILKVVDLDGPISSVMNPHPNVLCANESRENILLLMKRKHLRHVPILDADNHLVGLEILDEIIEEARKNNIVVLMAGGLGTRLDPLTSNCPKPLLEVGNKPILETILENFIESGFQRFYISVNYKGEMVEKHFGDGSKWGVEINYIREHTRLGTAGALSLLPEKPSQPILVMNGDLLTKVNFRQMLDFHAEHNVYATVCVREFDLQVPYGVMKIENHRLIGIDEKPVYRFFVNAGIYILQPEVLDFIPCNTFFDMTTLLEKVRENSGEIIPFPIREYWLDIGQMSDFERANSDFHKLFKVKV